MIPTGNCNAVENSVVACNRHERTYSIQSAVGIIDSDLKSPDDIGDLEDKKVYTLKCNEIEMLLFDKAIIEKVLDHQFCKNKPDVMSSIESDFFRTLTEKKARIIKRLVKTRIDELLHRTIINDKDHQTKDEMEAHLTSVTDKITNAFCWDECEKRVDEILAQRDYDEGLKYCCLGHNEVIGGIGNKYVHNYADLALGVLRNDQTLAEAVKLKYFADCDI